MYPKEAKLSMEYTVFHTSPLGWKGTTRRTEGFPYGNQSATSASEETTENTSASGFKEERYGIGTNGGGMNEEEEAALDEVLE